MPTELMASPLKYSSGTKLAPREVQILQMTADGENCKSAALICGISEHVVKNYRHRAQVKLGADSMAHAVAKAFRAQLIK